MGQVHTRIEIIQLGVPWDSKPGEGTTWELVLASEVCDPFRSILPVPFTEGRFTILSCKHDMCMYWILIYICAVNFALML